MTIKTATYVTLLAAFIGSLFIPSFWGVLVSLGIVAVAVAPLIISTVRVVRQAAAG